MTGAAFSVSIAVNPLQAAVASGLPVGASLAGAFFAWAIRLIPVAAMVVVLGSFFIAVFFFVDAGMVLILPRVLPFPIRAWVT